uniref:PKcGMP_CC domain-containing protein n=1 Tax=Steinernema glaseri TaxID=37863 RepID=A0A1I7ZEA4_9BILA
MIIARYHPDAHFAAKVFACFLAGLRGQYMHLAFTIWVGRSPSTGEVHLKPVDGAMEDEIREMKAHIAILESMLKKFKGTIDSVMARDAQLERVLKTTQNKLAELERVEKENSLLKARIAELEEITGEKSENSVLQYQ